MVAVDISVSATYPVEALALPKIGYQRSLSAEGTLSMEPSVVIGNTLAGRRRLSSRFAPPAYRW